jgi:hypothetical protein
LQVGLTVGTCFLQGTNNLRLGGYTKQHHNKLK